MLLFYRAADTIFGRIGRIATEEVVLHLLPVLLRGLEACSLRKTDLDSLDFVVNSLFMKLFHTSNNDTVKECHMFFSVLKYLVLFSRNGPKNFRNNTRTSRLLHVKVYIISSLVKYISYAVANVYEIVMSCGVYIIV